MFGMAVAPWAPFMILEAYIAEPAAGQLMGRNVTLRPTGDLPSLRTWNLIDLIPRVLRSKNASGQLQL
jgi:hypothetical protein